MRAELKGDDVVIRVATPEDARGIQIVRKKTWLTTYPQISPTTTKEIVEERFKNFDGMVAEMSQEMAKGEEHKRAFVAEEDGQIIGFTIAQRAHEGAMAEVLAFYVLKERQGRGHGSALMRPTMSWLDCEHQPVRLEVVAKNQGAIDIYEKWNFHKTRDMPPAMELPLEYRTPHIEMIREPASIV